MFKTKKKKKKSKNRAGGTWPYVNMTKPWPLVTDMPEMLWGV